MNEKDCAKRTFLIQQLDQNVLIEEMILFRDFNIEPFDFNNETDLELFNYLYYEKWLCVTDIRIIVGKSRRYFDKYVSKLNLMPHRRKVKIERDELYDYYVVQNHTHEETRNKYGVSKAVLIRVLKDYGIKKPQSLCETNKSKTFMERYGVSRYSKTKEFKDYITSNSNEIQSKVYNTKKKNHTFKTSKPEDDFYYYLCDKYGVNDVIRQYNKDSRYPFNCDFYVKSSDLFVELNLTWTHGSMPFDETNEKCIKKLIEWEERAKTSSYYKNAIEVWTRLDVRKINMAIENNLNYVLFYDKKELYDGRV